jgi:hypothetical protein
MLTGPVLRERFELVPRWDSEILKARRCMQYRSLTCPSSTSRRSKIQGLSMRLPVEEAEFLEQPGSVF